MSEVKPLFRDGRRALVGVVLGAIAVSAGLGIYALASAEFGETQWKILGTSGYVTAAGLLALGCLPALERRRLGPVPALGIVASLLGFGLLMIGMWAEFDSAPYWKTAGTALVAAVYATLVSLLSLVSLAARFRWTTPAAVGLGLVVAGPGRRRGLGRNVGRHFLARLRRLLRAARCAHARHPGAPPRGQAGGGGRAAPALLPGVRPRGRRPAVRELRRAVLRAIRVARSRIRRRNGSPGRCCAAGSSQAVRGT